MNNKNQRKANFLALIFYVREKPLPKGGAERGGQRRKNGRVKTAVERGAKTQICGGEKHTASPRCKRIMPSPRRDARESCRRPAETQEDHALTLPRRKKTMPSPFSGAKRSDAAWRLVFGKQKTKPAYIKIGAPTAPRSGFEKGSDICQTIMPSFSCSFSSAAVSISESASPRAK